MNTQTSLRLLRRLVTAARTPVTSAPARTQPKAFRPFSSNSACALRITPNLNDESDPYHKSSTEATGTSAGPHEGSASRTDKDIIVEYPEDESVFNEYQPPLRGYGGVQQLRTLPTFSLEGRTAVVTGGARGLGLVMGQALVSSGADLAIVDLNSMSYNSSLREGLCSIANAHDL
jgi:hypothetical protein